MSRDYIGTGVQVSLRQVPGSADRQWEAVVKVDVWEDRFKGTLAAVLAALQETLGGLAGIKEYGTVSVTATEPKVVAADRP